VAIPFAKYQGLGNHFVLIDIRHGAVPPLASADAIRLCDPATGIGADGLVLIDEGPRMAVLNADGSRPEMCGNGLRCLVRYLHDASEWPLGETRVVQTDAGPLKCRPLPSGDVEADLGMASFPKLPGVPAGSVPVDVGNPHLVCFAEDHQARAALDGPALEKHPAFPDRVNVGFANVTGASILALTVWERGVGLTLACGTGAGAAAAAAVEAGLLPEGEVKVTQAGGALSVHVGAGAQSRRPVRMTGPARRVYVGEVEA
jgi:diaminopimelate epimerase